MEESLQKWFDAICRFTKPLVEDPDDDDGEALTLFAHQALVASNSVSAAVFMPTVGGVWLCEAAATSSEGGASASGLIGTAFDLGDAQRKLLTEGETLPMGTQLFVPLKIQGALQGCLVLERTRQNLPFTSSDRQLAMAYGRQGALALDLIGSRQAHDLAVLFEERDRISRDLHDLGIQHLFQGREDKLVVLDGLLAELGLSYEQVAYLGDDLPDLPVIRRVGLGMAVASADGFVRQHAHGVTQARGGEGAAREFCELIMRGQGTLEAAQAAYL